MEASFARTRWRPWAMDPREPAVETAARKAQIPPTRAEPSARVGGLCAVRAAVSAAGSKTAYRAAAAFPAFTLIELLVVIGIIALIAAMLFPVFSRTREKGRQAVCVSHIRQMVLAFGMYSEDWDQQFPPDFTRGMGFFRREEAQGMWYVQLQPYIRNLGVLHCPSDNISDALRTSSGCAPDLRGDSTLPAVSYGANAVLILAWFDPDYRQFQTTAGIPRPAQTLLFGDSTEPWSFHICPETDPSGVRWSHVAYANGPPECRTGYHGGHSHGRHERHTEGSNLAFVDGHVQYMPADLFICRTERRGNQTIHYERPIIRPDARTPEEQQ